MDRLYDDLLLLIFNRIGDFKTLCRCCAVSRRFNDLATQVDNVVIKIDTGADLSETFGSPSSLSGLIYSLVFLDSWNCHRTLCRFLGNRRLGPDLNVVPSCCSPVLKKFKDIRVLKIELPSGYFYVDDDGKFLRWKAEFEPGFRKCVLLSATEHHRHVSLINSSENIIDFGVLGFLISGLPTMATRHLRELIAEHSKLDELVLTDADAEGVLCMTRLQELTAETTYLPLINVKVRYADQVSLTDGVVLEGVALAAVWSEKVTCDFANTFEEPFETSLRMWMDIYGV